MAKSERARSPEPENHLKNKSNSSNKNRDDFKVPMSLEAIRARQSEDESEAKSKEIDAGIKLRQKEYEDAKSKKEHEERMKEFTPAEQLKKAVDLENSSNSKQTQEGKEVTQENIKVVEEVVEGSTKEQIDAVDKAVAQKAITPEKGQQAKAVINNPEVQKTIFSGAFGVDKEKSSSIKDWIKDSPRLTSFLTGAATGMGVRAAIKTGFIAAFGANLPWLAAAGATAGGLLEGGRSIWRESKSYQSKEILAKFRTADYLEKAAMLSKMEELYKSQKFDADPEGYEVIRTALIHERTEMQIELDKKDGKFADFADKDKLQYILNLSQGIRGGIEKENRGREARNLIRDIEKSLEWKHDFKNVFANKKMVVVKATLKGAAYGAVGGMVGGVISHYMFGGSGGTVREVIQNKPSVADHFTQHLDHRGLTGGARDSLHQLIEEQRGIDPNFAHGITVEQLVYAEDTLAKEALHQGVHSSVADYTWSHDQLVSALDKASALGSHGTLTNAGAEHIHHIIGQKPHFLSELTRQKMLDFTPKDFSVITQEIASQSESLVLSAEDYAAMIGALLLVVASEVASADDRKIAQQQLEKLRANPPKRSSSDKLDYHKFPGWYPQKKSGPKPEGGSDGHDQSEGPENKETGPTEEEFAVRVAHYLNVKSEDPEMFKQALQDLQDYSKGRFDEDREDNFPDWKDSDFSKLIDGIDEAGEVKSTTQDGKSSKASPSAKMGPENSNDKSKQVDLEAGAEDERNGKITSNSINKKLRDAGFENIKVEPWPEEKISEEQKEQVQRLTDLFIGSAEVLNELKISNQIILNFYPNGERELDWEGSDIVVGIPLNSKGYNEKSFQSLVGEIVKLKVDELKNDLIKNYGFKLKPSWAKRAKKLSVFDQYRAYTILLENYTASQAEPRTQSSAVVPSTPPRQLSEMNLREQRSYYPNITEGANYHDIPEGQRKRAEELFFGIIEHDMKMGFPQDIKVIFSDHFETAPGQFTIDMSHNDREKMRRQIHEGRRFAKSGKVSMLSKQIRLPKSSLDSDKKNFITLKPLVESTGSSANAESNIQSEIAETVENNGLDQQWVSDYRSKISRIPRAQLKKFDQYFIDHPKVAVDKLLSQPNKLPDIEKEVPGTTLKEFEKYIQVKALDMVEELITKGGKAEIDKAHKLRDDYYEFMDAIKQRKKANGKKSKS